MKDYANDFSVFIVPDRNREERIEHRKLVEQLKVKNQKTLINEFVFGTNQFAQTAEFVISIVYLSFQDYMLGNYC